MFTDGKFDRFPPEKENTAVFSNWTGTTDLLIKTEN